MIEEIINNINYRLDNDNLTAEVTEKSGGYAIPYVSALPRTKA